MCDYELLTMAYSKKNENPIKDLVKTVYRYGSLLLKMARSKMNENPMKDREICIQFQPIAPTYMQNSIPNVAFACQWLEGNLSTLMLTGGFIYNRLKQNNQ